MQIVYNSGLTRLVLSLVFNSLKMDLKNTYFTIMKNKLIIGLLSITVILACEDPFDPQRDNRRSTEDLFSNPILAEGILLDAYKSLPFPLLDTSDIATDNAVTNDLNNSLLKMATGAWTSRFNPIGSYNNYFNSISRINYFLSIVDQVTWSYESEERNQLFKDRLRGEALALRSIFNFEILKEHGGIATNGELLGHPILDEFINIDDNYKLPRNSYHEVYQFIISDCEQAESLLVDTYTNDNEYSEVNGLQYSNRISGDIVRALKARYALHVASPAFNNGTANEAIMEEAANYAATSLELIGGLSGFDMGGAEFYNSNDDEDRPEILWRLNPVVNRTLENNNFPPSLFGQGDINPTQNLVDAFPDSFGFPVSQSTIYDEQNPYSSRDPRLDAYIIRDGSSFKGNIISTNVDDENNKDGLNNSQFSTRTGYYLKKMLRPDVNLDPNVLTNQRHYNVLIRYTELFLIYAEAANEVWGPDVAAPGVSFTARDVISAIRYRAGLNDQYLSTITSKESMRELIRNERRLELCFEGVRFWDMRRWGLSLSEPAKGLKISDGLNSKIDVEIRAYEDYMKYGPVPFSEVIKNDNMLQNQNW